MLTNEVVSFEQPGPVVFVAVIGFGLLSMSVSSSSSFFKIINLLQPKITCYYRPHNFKKDSKFLWITGAKGSWQQHFTNFVNDGQCLTVQSCFYLALCV